MPPFSATPKEFADAQQDFDWLIPWGQRKQLLTTEEVAQCIGYTQESVRSLIDSGKLETHQENVSGITNRLTNRVTRRSVAVQLMRTAQYGGEEIANGILGVLKTMSPEARRTLIARVQAIEP